MIELGVIQNLKIVKLVEFGAYLASDDDPEDKVLLPIKQLPKDSKIGNILEVFIYRDSKDRLIATTRCPILKLHETALLRVSQVGKFGAFLDWGLEKDLLLPFAEQTKRVKEGEECLAALYVDKSGRLCATMNVYPYLSSDSPYQKDDQVTGRVYETSPQFGMFVAVDDKYSALIPKKELFSEIHIGDIINARVTARKPDGKLDLSIREKAYLQIEKDADKILGLLQQGGGFLDFTDKASPERIREETGMSKNEFKRAVGNLLKLGKIRITENKIENITQN